MMKLRWTKESCVVVGYGFLTKGQVIETDDVTGAACLGKGCWATVPNVEPTSTPATPEKPAEPVATLDGLRRKKK
jgi:hypothetical protein